MQALITLISALRPTAILQALGALLTNYNVTTINYEPTGTPINWRNSSNMEWYGRQLTLFQHPDYSLSGYSYNDDDIRSNKKSVDANAKIIGGKNCYCCISTMVLAENKQRKNI